MKALLLLSYSQRLLGKRVVFITGTDEHGEKIAAAAEASGSSPSEHCDTISQSYKILWKEVIINPICNTCLSQVTSLNDEFNSFSRLAINRMLSSILLDLLQLDIFYDKFIRTTDQKHEAIVKEFYSRVLNNGDIYRADYEGLYCVNCEEYKVGFHSLAAKVLLLS